MPDLSSNPFVKKAQKRMTQATNDEMCEKLGKEYDKALTKALKSKEQTNDVWRPVEQLQQRIINLGRSQNHAGSRW